MEEKRYVTTPCCDYKQSTKAKKGEVIRCTICKKPFVERVID